MRAWQNLTTQSPVLASHLGTGPVRYPSVHQGTEITTATSIPRKIWEELTSLMVNRKLHPALDTRKLLR